MSGNRTTAGRPSPSALRFIELIRETLGPEPAGAELAIKSFPHDFGTYYEVVIWFEPDDAAAVAYAVRCEDDAPRTWNGERDSHDPQRYP